jgi:DNA-binding LacI/PurR family transcriptional regulator
VSVRIVDVADEGGYAGESLSVGGVGGARRGGERRGGGQTLVVGEGAVGESSSDILTEMATGESQASSEASLSGRPPTIRTVAARAGVSKSLVSLVLQDSPHVSERRRRAVLDAVAELGYRPDPSARSLAERRTRTVGVVIDDLSNPWFLPLLEGLRPVLHESALRPLLADGRSEPDAVNAMAELKVDGLVLVGSVAESALFQVNALGGSLPTVVAGTREPLLPQADVVANDDELGARIATRHLLELGHRRITHIVGEGEVGRLRRLGYEVEVTAAGIAPVTVQGDWTESTGHRWGAEILRSPERPTAVFAANDLSAVGVLAAADEVGLRVPEDLSVVGYDDTVFARLRRVSLTTVDSLSSDVGREAAQVLVSRLAGDDGDPCRRLLAPRLVVRSSTAAPPAGY